MLWAISRPLMAEWTPHPSPKSHVLSIKRKFLLIVIIAIGTIHDTVVLEDHIELGFVIPVIAILVRVGVDSLCKGSAFVNRRCRAALLSTKTR